MLTPEERERLAAAGVGPADVGDADVVMSEMYNSVWNALGQRQGSRKKEH